MSSPCVFRYNVRELGITVPGDDFATVGPKANLDWFEQQMQKNYELTIQPRLEPGPGDTEEAVLLNRFVRWTDEGIEYEADPRQVEKFVTECGMVAANSTATASDLDSARWRRMRRTRQPSTQFSDARPRLAPREQIIWQPADWTANLRPKKFAAGCQNKQRQHERLSGDSAGT